MTEARPPGSQHISVQWSPPKALSKEEHKKIVSAFTNTQHPLSSPIEPEPYSGGIEARLKRVETATFEEHFPDKPTRTKMQRLGKALNSMVEFARKHPWLTAGIVIALILFLATTYLTVSALMGHMTLAIFHAHPELGAGIAFMTLYYGVYLVNMARRAAMKDDLEERLKKHNAYNSQLATRRETVVRDIVKEMNQKIEEMSKRFRAVEKEMRESHQDMETRFQQATSLHVRISKYVKAIEKLLSKELTTEQGQLLKQALLQAKKVVEQGSKTLGLPKPGEPPLVPTIHITSGTITIPEEQTDTMRENARKARSMGEKFSAFFTNMGTYITQNPGSTALFATGIAMCALGGVAAYFWLNGFTSFYFFGSLSAMTIAPMVIYGLSLVYEGYNSRNINDLNRELKRIEKESEERKDALQEERRRIDAIVKKARGTFDQFAQRWQEFLILESEQLKSTRLELKKRQEWPQIEGFCRGIVETMATLYPDLNLSEARRVLTEPLNGATQPGAGVGF